MPSLGSLISVQAVYIKTTETLSYIKRLLILSASSTACYAYLSRAMSEHNNTLMLAPCVSAHKMPLMLFDESCIELKMKKWIEL